MNLLIATPAKPGTYTGNRITAQRWAVLLRSLGHTVVIQDALDSGQDLHEFDAMFGLHARRSAPAIRKWREVCGKKPLVVCLTGTDLNVDLANPDSPGGIIARQNLELADRIVLLEPNAAKLLESAVREKSVVIFQSARPLLSPPRKPTDCFLVSVIGHLREIKDPFLTEAASRLLCAESQIQIVQVGSALDPRMGEQAKTLEADNSRYRWIGPLPHADAVNCLAASHLTVSSSRAEGGSSVISEAVVNGIPILATRIGATLGMVGDDYPGLFEVGGAAELAELLTRAEFDSGFYAGLIRRIQPLAARFESAAEREALRELVAGLPSIQ